MQMLNVLSKNIVYLFVIFLNLIFLSYEFITFNEELFIALGFVAFFSALLPVFPTFINDFYLEDKNKLFNFLNEDIFFNYNFFKNFLDFVSYYEISREFFYQNLNFSLFYILDKFFNFFKNFHLKNYKNGLLEENLPEILYLFYERIIGFLLNKIQVKYLEYFLNKWDVSLKSEVISRFFTEERNLLESNSNISNWIYG